MNSRIITTGIVLAFTTTSHIKAETDASSVSIQYFTDYLSKTAAIKDDTARLAAYDKLAEYAKAKTEAENKANEESIKRGAKIVKMLNEKVAGDWRILKQKSPIDDSDMVILLLDSENGDATLHIRRSEGELNAFISTEKFLGSESLRVTTRVDKLEAVTRSWYTSNDHKAVFHPHPETLLKVLRKHKKLVVRLTPFSQNTQTYTFKLDGLDEIADQLK